MQLPCRLNFPASSNRNKVAAAGRHGRGLHPPDRAEPRPRVRLLGQAGRLHGPPPHHRRHRHCRVRPCRSSSRSSGESKLIFDFGRLCIPSVYNYITSGS